MANFFSRNWGRFGLLAINVVFWLIFALVSPAFLDPFNIFTVLRLASVSIVIGYSQMVTLSTGEMNLSVGALGGLMALVNGGLMEAAGVPVIWAVVLTLIIAGLLGMCNGLLVTGTGISSFVITLATASIFTGIMFIATQGNSYSSLPPDFVAFGKSHLFGLPLSPLVLITLLTAFLLYFLYRNTALGREMLAVGANREAARMSGVRSHRVIIISHMLSGALAGLAAIMTNTMLGSAVLATGTDWLMPSFVAPALGGTLMSGGYVSVFGTLLGGLLIGTLNSGVLLLGITNFWLQFFLGVVLLLAIGLDRLRAVYSERTIAQ